MITILAVAVIFAIYEWVEWEDIEYSIVGFFIGGFVGIIIYVFLGITAGFLFPVKEVIETHDLQALCDGSETNGNYFLFSGYVDEKLEIRYVVITEKGKHIDKANIDQSYINEGSYEPHVELHSEKFKYKWLYHVCWNPNFLDTEYLFYVPSGTVTNKYNVDLQ